MKQIAVLGTGCAKCHKLYDLVQEVVKRQDVPAEVAYIQDIKEFAKHGVFMTPALVVDGEVKVAGKVPKESEIVKWLSS